MPICIDCEGRGYVWTNGGNGRAIEKECPYCEGTGQVSDKKKEKEEVREDV